MILVHISSSGFIFFGCVDHRQTSTRTYSVDKIYYVKEPWQNPVHVQHAALVQCDLGDARPVVPDMRLISPKEMVGALCEEVRLMSGILGRLP